MRPTEPGTKSIHVMEKECSLNGTKLDGGPLEFFKSSNAYNCKNLFFFDISWKWTCPSVSDVLDKAWWEVFGLRRQMCLGLNLAPLISVSLSLLLCKKGIVSFQITMRRANVEHFTLCQVLGFTTLLWGGCFYSRFTDDVKEFPQGHTVSGAAGIWTPAVWLWRQAPSY